VLSAWFRRRYEWAIKEEEMVTSPGIVPALSRLVGMLTAPGENILIHTPSYTPFKNAGDYHGRQVFYSPLIQQESVIQ
jgi:cystathionine beta-lyase